MSRPRLATVKAGPAILQTARARPVQATKRPRGDTLYALMRSFETHNPRICAECKRQGLVSYGDELDHIVPLHLGGSNGHANLQWMCIHHHREKTFQEQKARQNGEGLF